MLKLRWIGGDGGAFDKVVENMRIAMGHDEKSKIIATCSARGTTLRGYAGCKKVWFGACNYNQLSIGRIESLAVPDMIVGISKFCSDVFSRNHKKVFAGHLGVDVGNYRPLGNQRPAWFRFLTTSSDTSYGKEVMMAAWRKAVEKMDRVDLIVKDHVRGGLSDAEIAEFEDMPKCKVIKPTGWRFTEHEMANFYRGVDCLLYPVPSIGNSLTCLESMACGTPAIIADYSAPPEFISLDVGYRVPVTLAPATGLKGTFNEQPMKGLCDVDKLSEQILHCYNNRREVRDKGEAACELVRSKYTWKHVAEMFSELVEKQL